MRKRERGVTLIEIIIAIIVMSLGLLGLLALLPAAIQYNRESAEETQASVVADSVKHAITEAVKIAEWDNTQLTWKVTLTHDLKDQAGDKCTYVFYLPKLADAGVQANPPYSGAWIHHPGSTGGNTSTPSPGKAPAFTTVFDSENDTVFPLETDGWLKATANNIRNVNDPTEPTRYFAFSFDVRKVDTALTSPTPPISDLDKKVKEFEFRVNILRLSANIGGGGTEPILGQTGSYEIVSSYTFKVAAP